jgi:hypothetical protein
MGLERLIGVLCSSTLIQNAVTAPTDTIASTTQIADAVLGGPQTGDANFLGVLSGSLGGGWDQQRLQRQWHLVGTPTAPESYYCGRQTTKRLRSGF